MTWSSAGVSPAIFPIMNLGSIYLCLLSFPSAIFYSFHHLGWVPRLFIPFDATVNGIFSEPLLRLFIDTEMQLTFMWFGILGLWKNSFVSSNRFLYIHNHSMWTDIISLFFLSNFDVFSLPCLMAQAWNSSSYWKDVLKMGTLALFLIFEGTSCIICPLWVVHVALILLLFYSHMRCASEKCELELLMWTPIPHPLSNKSIPTLICSSTFW